MLNFILGILTAGLLYFFIVRRFVGRKVVNTGALTIEEKREKMFYENIQKIINKFFENKDSDVDFVALSETATELSRRLQKYK